MYECNEANCNNPHREKQIRTHDDINNFNIDLFRNKTWEHVGETLRFNLYSRVDSPLLEPVHRPRHFVYYKS